MSTNDSLKCKLISREWLKLPDGMLIHLSNIKFIGIYENKAAGYAARTQIAYTDGTVTMVDKSLLKEIERAISERSFD